MVCGKGAAQILVIRECTMKFTLPFHDSKIQKKFQCLKSAISLLYIGFFWTKRKRENTKWAS